MWQARKGTATLFRADRRWAAIPAVTPSLTVEVFLKITQESVIPAPPLVASAFLNHLPFFASVIDEECVAVSKIFKEYTLQSASFLGDLISLLGESQFSVSDDYFTPINYISIGSSEILASLSCFSSLLSQSRLITDFQEPSLLLLLTYFSGEIPGKNIYSVLLRCNPLLASSISAAVQSSLLFLFKVLISRLNFFTTSFSGLTSCETTTASLISKSLLCSSLVSSIISHELSSNLILFILYSQFLNFLWHKSLIFKTLMEVGGLHSLIGAILIELSSASEFKRASEFTTEILTLLTSSIPFPKPVIPYGRIFFTNLGRIYGYSIMDLTRIYKYLMDIES